MKNKKYFLLAGIALLFACSSDPSEVKKNEAPADKRAALLAEISQIETEMHRSMEIDKTVAAKALKTYSDYSSLFPNDSLTPDYLFKAAEIATATEQYSKAVSYYQTIEDHYKDYKLYPESLFLRAALLDNYLNDDAQAKPVYQKVIDQFPKSSYAVDAKAAINNLGKTDEQLIKEFEKKNAGK